MKVASHPRSHHRVNPHITVLHLRNGDNTLYVYSAYHFVDAVEILPVYFLTPSHKTVIIQDGRPQFFF